MRNYDDSIEATAEYVCVELHPRVLRSRYVEHISVSYRAEIIVYVLQALSTGMTALFVGLLTNYLYGKAKKKRGIKEKTDLKKLVAEQKKTIRELEKLLKAERSRAAVKEARLSLTFHQNILVQIENHDSSLETLIADAIKQLEQKGKDKLLKHVDSYRESVDADYSDVPDLKKRSTSLQMANCSLVRTPVGAAQFERWAALHSARPFRKHRR
jgi:hypothetical protein